MSSIFDTLGIEVKDSDQTSDPMDKYEHLVPDVLPWNIHHGDALKVLKTLPDNYYDACYCDPPYGLSDRARVRQYEEAKNSMPHEVFASQYTPKEGSGTYILSFKGSASDAGLTFNEGEFQCLVNFEGEDYRLTLSTDGDSGRLDQDFSAWQSDLNVAGNIAHLVEVDEGSVSLDRCKVTAPNGGEIGVLFNRKAFLKSMSQLPSGGFMGRGWDSDVPSPEVWREVWRVLKPRAPLLAFGGTRMWHRLAVNIEDAGFEIRDTFMWVTGQGFPKGLDISKGIDKKLGAEREVVGKGKSGTNRNAMSGDFSGEYEETLAGSDLAKKWEGYKTALKPAWEPIVVAQKPVDGTYVNNALEHGVAGYNIDGSRIGKDGDGRYPANVVLSHTPECRCVGTKKVKSATAHQDNKSKANSIYAGGFNPKGLSGVVGYADEDGKEEVEAWECSPECPVKILDDQSGTTTSGAMKRQVGAYEGESVTGLLRGNSGPSNQYGDTGGASRFFYCAKASRSEREAGLVPEEGEKRANRHPTVKAIDLNRYFTKLILPPARDDQPRKMLIPFSGVGSEMIGAFKGGWDHVTGIELQEEYVEIAHQRLKWWIYGGGADE